MFSTPWCSLLLPDLPGSGNVLAELPGTGGARAGSTEVAAQNSWAPGAATLGDSEQGRAAVTETLKAGLFQSRGSRDFSEGFGVKGRMSPKLLHGGHTWQGLVVASCVRCHSRGASCKCQGPLEGWGVCSSGASVQGQLSLSSAPS